MVPTRPKRPNGFRSAAATRKRTGVTDNGYASESNMDEFALRNQKFLERLGVVKPTGQAAASATAGAVQ